MKDTLKVKVFISDEGLIYENEATSVTSKNTKGVFDILMQHQNFATLVSKFIVINGVNNEKKEFKFEKGLLVCRHNIVEMFIGL